MSRSLREFLFGREVDKEFDVEVATAEVTLSDGEKRTITRKGYVDFLMGDPLVVSGTCLLESYIYYDGQGFAVARIKSIKISKQKLIIPVRVRTGGIL
jgi:hypothetical protein